MKPTSRVREWSKAVHTALAAEADPRTREWAEKYFLGAIDFHGVKGPRVKAVHRDLKAAWRDAPLEQQAALGFALQARPFMEERQVGQLVLDGVARKLVKQGQAGALVDALEPIFARHVRDWATCDALAGRVLRACLADDAARKRIVAWSRAKASAPGGTWQQRASAVAFVNEARKGAHDDDVIAVCTRIVKTPERFVQLGCGWVLRELSLHDRARVLAFLDAHADHISREGLRYATEKLPPAVRARVHEAHAKQTGRGRVRV